MINFSKFQSNFFAAIFAVAMSALFIGVSVIPAEVSATISMVA